MKQDMKQIDMILKGERSTQEVINISKISTVQKWRGFCHWFDSLMCERSVGVLCVLSAVVSSGVRWRDTSRRGGDTAAYTAP